MWRKTFAYLQTVLRRSDANQLRAGSVIPIAVVVVVAIVCVVVAVLTAAGRADDVQLQQERLLLTNAVADRANDKKGNVSG